MTKPTFSQRCESILRGTRLSGLFGVKAEGGGLTATSGVNLEGETNADPRYPAILAAMASELDKLIDQWARHCGLSPARARQGLAEFRRAQSAGS